jgi:hypothetical protein
LLGALIQGSKHIHELQMMEYTGKPCTLLRQKSGVLAIRSPVLEIDLAMRDVPVAAENDFASADAESMQMRDNGLKKLEFHRESQLGGRT